MLAMRTCSLGQSLTGDPSTFEGASVEQSLRFWTDGCAACSSESTLVLLGPCPMVTAASRTVALMYGSARRHWPSTDG